MHVMLLTFGADLRNHYQANFSILSFLKEGSSVRTVDVFTDRPDLYRHLGDRATMLAVDQALLEEWTGPHRFFWRIKIKAIEAMIERYGAEPVVYVDSDTFLTDDAAGFARKLEEGGAFLHENEGRLQELRQKTTRRMWSQIANRTFAGIRIDGSTAMWNAGVVGVPARENARAIQLALDLCDEMCAAGVTPRLIEQYAISVALDTLYDLHPATPWIAHYWGNKEEWNQSISGFFVEADLRGLTFEQKLEQLRAFDHRSIPVRKQRRKSNERVRRLADALFPPLKVLYHGG